LNARPAQLGATTAATVVIANLIGAGIPLYYFNGLLARFAIDDIR
jgi:hypothetical protein